MLSYGCIGQFALISETLNSCRLCKSGSLAFVANFADVTLVPIRATLLNRSGGHQEQGTTAQAIRSWSDNCDDDVAKDVRTMTHHIVWLQEMAAREFVGDKFPAGDVHR